MTETFYRKERQPDGSIVLRSKSYSPDHRNCMTCEWCKQKNVENNKEISDVMVCKLKDKILGCSHLIDPYGDRDPYTYNIVFIPIAPECKSSFNNHTQTSCSDYLPYGWHLRKSKITNKVYQEDWVLE